MSKLKFNRIELIESRELAKFGKAQQKRIDACLKKYSKDLNKKRVKRLINVELQELYEAIHLINSSYKVTGTPYMTKEIKDLLD